MSNLKHMTEIIDINPKLYARLEKALVEENARFKKFGLNVELENVGELMLYYATAALEINDTFFGK